MKKVLILASVLSLNVAPLQAAGIAILEQSVSGFKTGYAGAVTSIDEPSTVFFNPAGLSRAPGTQFTLGGHIIKPEGKFVNEGSTINGQPLRVRTGDSHKDVAENFYIPNVYASHQLNNKATLGLGVFSPYGLGIEHDSGWIGRYHGTKNDLLTININPSIAYKATPCLTFGVGFSAQYEKAELGTDIDFGGIAQKRGIPGAVTQGDDGSVTIKGDGWAYGFNLGLLYEPTECLRWGVSYRSSLASALKGDAVFKRSATGDLLMNASGLFKDTKVETEITLPETVIFGVYDRFADQFAFMADVQYTNWNRFRELRVQFENPLQPDQVIDMNWKGRWRYAAGLHYYPNTCTTFGIGGGIDKSPVTNKNRTPRIPDADRTFWTAGVSYHLNQTFSLDAGVGKFYFKTPRLNIVTNANPADPRSVDLGSIKGHFESSLTIYNFGLRARI